MRAIKCRQIYKAFVSKLVECPTATRKWNELYAIDMDSWTYYFKLPYDVCCDTELQTLQYKIINRFSHVTILFQYGIMTKFLPTF